MAKGIAAWLRGRDVLGKAGRVSSTLALGIGLFWLLSLWLGRAAAAPSPEPTPEPPAPIAVGGTALVPDPRVVRVMGRITTGTLVAYERALTGEAGVLVNGQAYTLTTRNSFSGEPISQATRYVYERFADLGLDVAFHEYVYAGHRWRNVVAERRGLRRPDEITIITAHLDDMPGGSVAPGADDNASGSTAVLVAAETLGQLGFDCTLRFVLFTGEEQGLRGSAAYAADVSDARENVRAVLNLDMIAYNSDASPIVDLHTRSTIAGSSDIAETFANVVAAYDLQLVPEILVDDLVGNYSDNKSFWNQGYPAILGIEDANDFNPNYHTTSDRLDGLDLEYFLEFVRAGVGTLAHMGCLSTGLLTGTVTALDSGLPLSAAVLASADLFSFTTTTDGNGYYSLTLPAFTFTLGARANGLGYYPSVVTELAIRANDVTTHPFVLEPWRYAIYIPVLQKAP